MALSLVTPPSEEPISVEELRRHLRLEEGDDGENVLLLGLIEAARRRVEVMLRRSIITSTWDYYLDDFPVRRGQWTVQHAIPRQDRRLGRVLEIEAITLPNPPLQSIVSIQYLDGDDVLQTLASSAYTVDTASEPARVVPSPDSVWPTNSSSQPNAVVVRFVAGYGLAAAVPASIKLAVSMLAAHWYENREAVASVPLSETPLGVAALLDSERWGSYL